MTGPSRAVTTGTLVVGAGQAALSFLTRMRALGDTEPVLVVGEEGHLPYERPPLSKGVLAGTQEPDTCTLRETGWFAAQHVDLLLEDPVIEVARDSRGGRAVTRSGREVSFRRLAICTGSTASLPPALVTDDPHVVTVRTLSDAAHLHTRVRDLSRVPGPQAVVVGGGFLGLEVAAVLRRHGLGVTVLEAGERLMARSVSPVVSAGHLSWHASHGTRVLLGTSVIRLLPQAAPRGGSRAAAWQEAGQEAAVGAGAGTAVRDARTFPVRLQLASPTPGRPDHPGAVSDHLGAVSDHSGAVSDRAVVWDHADAAAGLSALGTDLVVVCTGARPVTHLAEQLALEVDGGIVVDAGALTSDGLTVAAGDCTVGPVDYLGDGTRLPRVRLESVDNAEVTGARAAATLLGVGEPARHVPWFWSDQGALRLQVAGLPVLGEESIVRGDPGGEDGYTVLHLRGDQVVASECVGRPGDHVVVKRSLDSGRGLDASDRRRLADPVVPLRTMLRK